MFLYARLLLRKKLRYLAMVGICTPIANRSYMLRALGHSQVWPAPAWPSSFQMLNMQAPINGRFWPKADLRFRGFWGIWTAAFGKSGHSHIRTCARIVRVSPDGLWWVL